MPSQGIFLTLSEAELSHRRRATTEKYSTFAVLLLWMLREQQENIDNSLPQPLPPDEGSPFNSRWVFSKARQEALCDLFFGKLTPDSADREQFSLCSLPEILCLWAAKPHDLVCHSIKHLAGWVRTGDWASSRMTAEHRTSYLAKPPFAGGGGDLSSHIAH